MDEWTAGYEACKSRLAKILIPQIKANAIPDTHCIVPKDLFDDVVFLNDYMKEKVKEAMIAASQNDNWIDKPCSLEQRSFRDGL